MLWLPREGGRRERRRKCQALEPLPHLEVDRGGSRNDGFKPQEKVEAEGTNVPGRTGTPAAETSARRRATAKHRPVVLPRPSDCAAAGGGKGR